jgi:hypothetical protein
MLDYAPGKYAVTLSGVQGFSEAKSSGNSQFYMKFTPTHRWDMSRNEWVEVDQIERTFYRAITVNTAPYFAEDIRALGYSGDKLSKLDMRHPEAHIFEGQIEMICNHETYEGKTREKWGLLRGTAHQEKPADPAAVKKLDTLFGAALKAVPVGRTVSAPDLSAAKPIMRSQPRSAGNGAAAAVAEPPPANDQGVTDDDIPF